MADGGYIHGAYTTKRAAQDALDTKPPGFKWLEIIEVPLYEN